VLSLWQGLVRREDPRSVLREPPSAIAVRIATWIQIWHVVGHFGRNRRVALASWWALSWEISARVGLAGRFCRGLRSVHQDAQRRPRVVLAPLSSCGRPGHLSKVAPRRHARVFFVMFFKHVFQGVAATPTACSSTRSDARRVRSGSSCVTARASALTWIFSSLQPASDSRSGGAVVGEYLGRRAASAT